MPSKTKQTSSAQYVVYLPTHDHYGNLLKDFGPPAHEWLAGKLGRNLHSIHVEGPHAGHRDPHSTFRHLHVVATDSPETDSHIKQLGVHVAQLANHPTVFVLKHSGEKLDPWTLQNRAHTPGPAHPEAVAFQSAQPVAQRMS